MAEVLSPCGSFETLEAVLKTGTDAVYLGAERFSARAGAHNFNREELARAAFECHARGVKIYQAINTVITDDELPALEDELRFACETGIDGIILQDLAVLEMIKKCCPEMPAHASTQMTLHTVKGAELAKDIGFCRVVLSRELPFEIISEISKLPVETEVFVHGALCMSVSGQCYMSSVIGQRSANRGMCAQACRLPASAVKGQERYDLSLKDMSYIPKLCELEAAGVTSLKIEGRMKRPEYTASAADACNKALAGEKPDMDMLARVFSRGGFTDGYFYKKTGREMFGIRTKENVTNANEALPKIHELYRHEHKYAAVSFFVFAHTGEPLRLEAKDNDGNAVTVTGDVAEAAINHAADEEYLARQLSKLGDTVFVLSEVKADIAGSPVVTASALNKLRREVCRLLFEKRADKNTNKYDFSDFKFTPVSHQRVQRQGIRLFIEKPAQLDLIDTDDLEYICFAPELASAVLEKGVPAKKCSVIADRFTFDEAALTDRLKQAKALGINDLTATNLSHIRIASELSMRVHTDFGLNITNSVSAKAIAGMGALDITLSFEMKSWALKCISSPVPVGVFAYGRLPLMLTANCPLRQAVTCKGCSGKLYDRTGRAFKIKCRREQGYVEVLNSEMLIMSDKTADLAFADFLNIVLYDESPERAAQVVKAYKNGTPLDEKNITRGLYYRGMR